MNTQDERLNTNIATTQIRSDFENYFSEKFEDRVKRFERIGLRMFSVANCLINFGDIGKRYDKTERSMAALEAAFCESMPFPDEVHVIADARTDPILKSHRLVLGAPYIRFYVAHPIRDSGGRVVGCLSLIDYNNVEFDDICRQLLSDLILLIERELAVAALYQTHLELVKQNRNLKRDSMIDPLLGTWNKAAIVRSLRIEMERCAKAEKPLSLLVVSLDQAAGIQNQYGIAANDIVMVRTVSRIRSCIRPFDAMGRFGSDIFLLVLPGASHLVSRAVAERIRISVMTHPEVIETESISLSVTVGTSSTDQFPDVEPEDFISLAERALLSAKNIGQNNIVQASPVSI